MAHEKPLPGCYAKPASKTELAGIRHDNTVRAASAVFRKAIRNCPMDRYHETFQRELAKCDKKQTAALRAYLRATVPGWTTLGD